VSTPGNANGFVGEHRRGDASNINRSNHTRTSSSEKFGLGFEPDVLIQHRYADICPPNSNFQPERLLMLAVLEDAILCLQRFHRPANRRESEIYRNAEAWFCDDDFDWPYSFVNICQYLGFDTDYLRHGLLRWLEGHATERSAQAARGDIGPKAAGSAR
jgi:hypothetical protein